MEEFFSRKFKKQIFDFFDFIAETKLIESFENKNIYALFTCAIWQCILSSLVAS